MYNKKEFKKHLPWLLFLILLTLIFFLQYFNEKLPAHDITTGYLPLARTLKISALEYKDFWPLWNPYGFSGTPLLMKPLFGLDGPLGVLILTIPNSIMALKLMYVLLFLVSGISMYALMIYLKLERKFAFISSLIYMLNGHMAKLLFWSWGTTIGGYALLPLAFMYGMKTVKEKEWIMNSIITGTIFGIMLHFNPDMKVVMWLGLLYGLYLIFNLSIKPSKKRLMKTVAISILIMAVFLGLSAHRIMPNADFIKISSRGETSWEIAGGRQLKYSAMFDRLIEPIYEGMPKIQRRGTGDHIGIVAFLLALFAIYKKRDNKIVIFFTLGAIFSIFVANNTFNLYYLLWRFVPFFKSLRYMDRSLFLFVFCLSILAGIGAEQLFTKIKNKNKLIYTGLLILILLNIWVFNYNHYTDGSTELWENGKEALENNHILQHISKQPGLFRIQTWETRGIDWGTDFYNVPLKLEHIYRYDPMWYPPYMNMFLSVSFNDPAKFWGILNVKYVTAKEKINVSGLNLINKFENCTTCWPNEENWAKAWGPYLYENELFLPRAYIVKNSLLVVGEEAAVTQSIYALMLNSNFNPSTTTIIKGKKSINDYHLNELKKHSAIFLTQGSIDQNSIFTLQQYVNDGGILLPDITKNKNSISESEINVILNSFEGELKAIKDENIIMHNFDKREIKLNGERGFLVYSEKFSVFEGWNVKDKNNDRLQLLNADAMISAVHLEGEEKSLIFEYKPKSHTRGLSITLLTIAVLMGVLIYSKSKTIRKFISKRTQKQNNKDLDENGENRISK